MASTYLRPDSPFIWIRYKDATGKWRNANSGYRKENFGDRKQAKLMAREKSLEELAKQPASAGKSEFDQWVAKWIVVRWGNGSRLTLKQYQRYFMKLREYFAEIQISTPICLTREHVLDYVSWRGEQRNSAIFEIKFLAMALDEAINRGFIKMNVARKLNLSQTEHKPKTPWTEDEVAKVGAALAEMDEFGWMHVTFLMGLYQASRMQQCAVPLRLIDFRRGVINYADSDVKGGKGFSQPIDPDFFPILQAIAQKRLSLKERTLCTIPQMSSVLWRQFLDGLGLHHLSHHGLRATWITRAALAGVPESQSRRFANHASQAVHQIYQRISAADLHPIFGMMRQPPLMGREMEKIEHLIPCRPTSGEQS